MLPRFLFRSLSLCLIAVLFFATSNSRASEKWQRVTSKQSVEFIKGGQLEVKDTLVVIFVKDSDHYIIPKPDQLTTLSEVRIDKPNGLEVELLDTEATATEVSVSGGTGTGYALSFHVRLSATKDLKSGTYKVTMSYPQASVIKLLNKTMSPSETPSCTLTVTVWASAESRALALKEQADREQREADQKALHTLLTWIAVIGGLALLITVIVLLRKLFRRVFAKRHYRVAVGQALTFYMAHTEEKTIGEEAASEPQDGFTRWVRPKGFFWGGDGVRICCEGTPRGREVYVVRTDYSRGGRHMFSTHSLRAKIVYEVQGTITVRPGTPSGWYLAECPGGEVAIHVTSEKPVTKRHRETAVCSEM